MMMSATAGAAEHGLAQQMTTSQQLEWVSKLGEIQQTIDQPGELKRGDGWVQHTEAAEAQRIRTDRAEATLQILGELNLNMHSEIETGSESGPRATNTIHAQVAGRRATERIASTHDATSHTRGF